jgi:hypothetical protein
MTKVDIIILSLFAGVGLFYYLFEKCKRLRLQHKLKKVIVEQLPAIHFLVSEGYTIDSIEERKNMIININGKIYKKQVAADLIVEKEGKSYVALVKNGMNSLKPILDDICSQLLEHYQVFQPDGILLIDMEQKEIHEISVSGLETSRRKIMVTFVAITIGLFLCLIFYKINVGGQNV